MTTKTKSRNGANRAASKLRYKLNFISTAAWVLEYSLAEALQSHETHRRYVSRVACRTGLAVLRLLTGGLHHA